MISRDNVLMPELSVDLEPDATTLYDLSRYRNNGAQKGAGEPDAVQLPSGAWVWDFDTNDYIDFTHSDSINFSDDFYFSLWLNSDVPLNVSLPGTYSLIFFKQNAYQFLYYGPAQSWIFYPDHATNKYGIYTITHQANTWINLIVSWDESAQKAYMCIDGVNGEFNMDAPGPLAQSSNNLRLGAVNWDGMISPPKFGNGLLTSGQGTNYFEKRKYLYGVHD